MAQAGPRAHRRDPSPLGWLLEATTEVWGTGSGLPAQGERRHRGEAAAASLFRNHRSLYDMVLAHKEVVTNWEQVK